MDAKVVNRNSPPSTGTAFSRPECSLIWRLWVRS